MAKIPTHTRQVVPSGNVAGNVIPTSIANTGQGIEAQGLANLGKGVTNVAQATQQIAFAEGQSQAGVAAVEASAVMEGVKAGLKRNNDVTTYKGILDDAVASLSDFAPKSTVGQKSYNDFLERATPQWESEVKIQGIQTSHANAESNYLTAWSGAVAQGKLDLADFLTLSAEQSGVLTPQESSKQINKSEVEVNKIRKAEVENAVASQAFDAWQLSVSPDNPDGDTDAALDLIDSSGLPEVDKQEMESEVLSRISNRNADNKVVVAKQKDDDLGDVNKAMYIDKNYSAATAAVLASKALTEKEKGPLLAEIERRANLVNKSQREVDDPIAVDEVSTAMTRLASDTIGIAETKAILTRNQSKLKSTTASRYWEEVNETFSKSAASAYSRVRTDTRSQAVGKAESALDVLIAASLGAKGKEKKSLEERITTGRQKFNLELVNFNNWESSMRDWRRKNPDASPESIQKEGVRSWATDFEGKDVDVLRKEREEQIKKLNTKPVKAKKVKGKAIKPKPFPVKVRTDKGKIGTIMSDQLEKALRRGWEKI